MAAEMRFIQNYKETEPAYKSWLFSFLDRHFTPSVIRSTLKVFENTLGLCTHFFMWLLCSIAECFFNIQCRSTL